MLILCISLRLQYHQHDSLKAFEQSTLKRHTAIIMQLIFFKDFILLLIKHLILPVFRNVLSYKNEFELDGLFFSIHSVYLTFWLSLIIAL